MINVRFKGIDVVVNNINEQIRLLPRATARGLLLAALHIRRQMEREPPKTPVKTGNMRSSFYTRPMKIGSSSIAVELGYTAYYAPRVHEMTSPSVRWTRKGSGALWFLSALQTNAPEILRIIQKAATIKGRK